MGSPLVFHVLKKHQQEPRGHPLWHGCHVPAFSHLPVGDDLSPGGFQWPKALNIERLEEMCGIRREKGHSDVVLLTKCDNFH